MSQLHLPQTVSRRTLLKGLALGSLTALMSDSTVRAHQADALQRELHLYMGDGYYRSEDFADGRESARTEPNAPITLQAGTTLLLIAHNEGRALHWAYFGRDPRVAERRFGESLFDGFHSYSLQPRGVFELELTVPDKPGDWEIGDFALNPSGQTHYETGMKTALIVEA